MLNDLRLALRLLRKSPAFAVVAVSTLGIGIGITASLFAVVSGLVREPLPYPDPDRIVEIWGKDKGAVFDFVPFSVPDYVDLETRLTSIDEIGAFSVRRFNIGGDVPEAIDGALTTQGLLRVVGVGPLHGRLFTKDDERSGAALAIISHELWTRRLRSDPGVIGRTIRLDGKENTIVGVMPEGYRLLSAWTRNRPLAVWTLLRLRPEGEGRGNLWLATLARVKRDVAVERAGAELREVAERMAQANPETNARRAFWLMPLARQVGGLPALRVSILLAAGWTVLVLAGHTVAGMLLARGIARQPEMAIRAALGANRCQIARLVLAESVVLGIGATALGSVLTLLFLGTLPILLPPEVMPRSGLRVDGWLIGSVVLLALVAVQMAGTSPALLAAKIDALAIREGGVTAAGTQRARRRLRSLVVIQISVALLLVSVALQFSTAYRQLVSSSQTVAVEQVVTAAVAVKGGEYDDERRAALWERLVERTASIPGVLRSAVTTKLPYEGGISTNILVDGETFDPGKPVPWTEVSYVSPGFFEAMGTTIHLGRALDREHAAARRRLVVINRAMAERYWPGRSALGGQLRPATRDAAWTATVVGVVDDLRQEAERPARPEMYFAFGDEPREDAYLVLRMVQGLPAPIEAIREELARLDPDLALCNVRSMASVCRGASNVLRALTGMVDVLTIAILGLAALGLYGALSFHFDSRRRELGVRLSLGASARDVALLVIRQALVWVALGGSIGAAGSILLRKGISAVVQDSSGGEFEAIALGVMVVLATALAAAFLPARRVAKLDPSVALRCE